MSLRLGAHQVEITNGSRMLDVVQEGHLGLRRSDGSVLPQCVREVRGPVLLKVGQARVENGFPAPRRSSVRMGLLPVRLCVAPGADGAARLLLRLDVLLRIQCSQGSLQCGGETGTSKSKSLYGTTTLRPAPCLRPKRRIS